jgi:hypothetical protein
MAVPSLNLDLTILDHTILRVYVRQLLIFPFPNTSHESDAIATLRAGLLATLRQYPFLAGTLEQTVPLGGAMIVRYPDKVDSGTVSQVLSVNRLESFGIDYNTLCNEGIPPSRLPSDVLCPLALRLHPGLDDPFAEGLTTFIKTRPIPVFAAQANFIPEGLILSAYTHHSIVDGTGIARLYQTWSGNTRSYERQEQALIQTNDIDPNIARRAFDSLALNAPIMDLPEFRYPGDPVPNPPLRNGPYKLNAKIFVFSASAIDKLANSLSSITQERISSFTALTALIWCQVTNARKTALIEKGIQMTTVGTAIDHRKRVGSLLPNDYIGNAASGLTVSLPLSAIPSTGIMDDKHIAPVALAISNGLSMIDLDWFRARLSHMSKQPNPSKLVLNMDTCNGPDIFITSWMHIGADDVWAIPGTALQDEGGWGCKPTAIRKPKCANEGGMQILPRQKETGKPFEVLVCLEEGEMERTVQSLQEGKWVERVVNA